MSVAGCALKTAGHPHMHDWAWPTISTLKHFFFFFFTAFGTSKLSHSQRINNFSIFQKLFVTYNQKRCLRGTPQGLGLGLSINVFMVFCIYLALLPSHLTNHVPCLKEYTILFPMKNNNNIFFLFFCLVHLLVTRKLCFKTCVDLHWRFISRVCML